MRLWRLACLLVPAALVVTGCSTLKDVLGITTSEPSVAIKSAETRWLLIKNPRFGDVRSEPEYVWVEEDKVPFTIGGVFNKNAILAPPEVVAKYGPPPGGGKISARQGVAYPTGGPTSAVTPAPPVATDAARTAPRDGRTPAAVAAAPRVAAATPAPEPPKRGFVVYMDTARIVIDLTNADGLRAGSIVSVRRDKIPIVHPVTGEVLGELDDEVATLRVTEIRERFSVAEVQSVSPGSQIQVKDRVVLK